MLMIMNTNDILILTYLLYSRNPRVPCDSLPSMDLTHWSDRGSNCMINNRIVATGKTVHISPCVTCVCTKEGVSVTLFLYIFFSSLSSSSCN